MLEELKQAVDSTEDISQMEEYSDVKILRDTCQLFLNSPRVVGNKVERKPIPSLSILDNSYMADEAIIWNACNEANRIARVKWLSEKLEGLKRKLTVPMMDIVRQHFERGEL
jgi:hypothetical protein